jgi:hypothetical protein
MLRSLRCIFERHVLAAAFVLPVQVHDDIATSWPIVVAGDFQQLGLAAIHFVSALIAAEHTDNGIVFSRFCGHGELLRKYLGSKALWANHQ